MQGDVYRLYANTKAFYIRDLTICRFWYLQGVLELFPEDTEGQLHSEKGIES